MANSGGPGPPRPNFPPLISDADLIKACSELSTTSEYVLFIRTQNDEAFSQGNPFHLKREIKECFTDKQASCTMHRIRSGDILVKTTSAVNASNLLQVSSLINKPVTVQLSAEDLLYSYVIKGVPTGYSRQEIIEDLADQGFQVYSLERFTKLTEGKWQDMTTIKVKTIAPMESQRIHVGVQMFYVSLYTEAPRQCRKCWSYGHGPNSCRSTIRCRFCGADHDQVSCPSQATPVCLHCGNGHAANDRSCDKRKLENDILKYKTAHRISYGEAKRVFTAQAEKKVEVPTYAQAVGAQIVDEGSEAVMLTCMEVPALQDTLNELKEVKGLVLTMIKALTELANNFPTIAQILTPVFQGSQLQELATDGKDNVTDEKDNVVEDMDAQAQSMKRNLEAPQDIFFKELLQGKKKKVGKVP